MKKKTEKIHELLNFKKGPLSKEQIAVSMHFCYCNAKELYEEAKILIQHKKIARAFGLCVLSLEELGKIPLLINCLLLKKDDDAQWKKFWKYFSSHKLKQNIWSIYGVKMFAGTEREKYYKRRYSKELPSLEKMKQLSFYVNIIDDQPMIPSIFFEHMKGIVGLVYKMTEDRIEAFRPLHSTLARSRRAVTFVSRIKFNGASEDELKDMLFPSLDAVTSFCEKK